MTTSEGVPSDEHLRRMAAEECDLGATPFPVARAMAREILRLRARDAERPAYLHRLERLDEVVDLLRELIDVARWKQT